MLCSHLLDEVERVCDRVAIMHHGSIVAEGTVDDVITASGVAGVGTIRVAPDDIGRANDALRDMASASSLRFDNTRPGDIEIDLTGTNGTRTDILRLLIESGVEPRSFDLQGARLSNAFLALTGAAPQGDRPGSR